MDKNIILNKLQKTFLKESETPAITKKKEIDKKNASINSKGVKEIADETKAFSKVKKGDESTMAQNKFNYTPEEKEFHDILEIGNGQEKIRFDNEPNKEYQKKAKEAIVGSSRMGNAKGGNAEAAWDASSDEFGKDKIKAIKKGAKFDDKNRIPMLQLGDDVELLEKPGAQSKGKSIAISENLKKENTMKRLTSKKPFNGLGNALKLIPESYRVDKKVFELTDKNELYTIRWEGSVNEGKAVVLKASDNKLINEDIQRMKALFNYRSEDTLGLVKGKSRIDENAVFGDIYAKTKKLLSEDEDIEDVTAPVENDDDAGINQAADAKKHIEGSVPQTDLGGEAPSPKSGEWEEIKKPQAADAKKHVEGSVSQTDLGGTAPAPKVGEWEKINKAHAAEAKEHLQENEEMDDDDDEGDDDTSADDNYYKADSGDDNTDAEPAATDVAAAAPELAPKPNAKKVGLFRNGEGKFFVMVKGSNSPHEVPAELLSLARKDPDAALQQIIGHTVNVGDDDDEEF